MANNAVLNPPARCSSPASAARKPHTPPAVSPSARLPDLGSGLAESLRVAIRHLPWLSPTVGVVPGHVTVVGQKYSLLYPDPGAGTIASTGLETLASS
jgi:hypothetical protein